MKTITKLTIILLAIMLTASAMPANVIDARMTANGANLTVAAPDGEQGASWLWQDGNDSKKMIMHLVEHVRRGHKVPDYVFEAFLEDLK